MLSLFSQSATKQIQPSIVPETIAAVVPALHSIRVLETDERLANVSSADFAFDGVASPLAIAFISPHSDFRRVTAALQSMAGQTPVIAVSTAGELCSASGALYKATGTFVVPLIVAGGVGVLGAISYLVIVPEIAPLKVKEDKPATGAAAA